MLIVFEGLDQSGKETQARRLRTRLAEQERTVRALSFPDYETPIGQTIGRALAGSHHFGADVMQLLYVANRLEHRPSLDGWLAAGDLVVCDRFRASSVAYGEAHGLDPAWLADIQRPLPEPDVTLLLDIAPDRAARRKEGGRDVFERNLALLARVRESYRRQAAAPGWVLVDADRSPDDVAADVWAAVDRALAR